MIPDWEILLRLLIAAALGALVGVERERSGQSAGLRTHLILAVGSTLAMVLSINIAIEYKPLGTGGDPARLAAQVISGIGFLGAGAILRYGTSIRGLTTATSLWTLAIVGLVVGAGYYLVAAAATVLVLVALFILNILEHRVISPYEHVSLTLSAEDRPALIKDLHKLFDQHQIRSSGLTVQKNLRRKTIKIEVVLWIHRKEGVETLMVALNGLSGVRAYRVG
jgi:putative Mg2+ transporter-C (MgtC) family protein